ncbi:MAG TPA: metal-dependent hydrolase [Opitutaceae bacterium]|nr:metal-dependent hydrolase [Opitutaceae bacterium]
MLNITWLSHSSFLVQHEKWSLLFDPYFTGNPKAKTEARDVRCTHVFCSHAHEDHSVDVIEIAERNQAPIFAPYELSEYFSAKTKLPVFDLMTGGTVKTEFGRVQLTPAWHSSAREMPEGQNLALGEAAGFLVTIGGKIVYHAGDTALFSDMRLLARQPIDVAFLPIGDYYTMGIDDAVAALDLLCPRLTFPMHYNTTEKIAVDPDEFVGKAAAAGHRVKVLSVGETFSFS